MYKVIAFLFLSILLIPSPSHASSAFSTSRITTVHPVKLSLEFRGEWFLQRTSEKRLQEAKKDLIRPKKLILRDKKALAEENPEILNLITENYRQYLRQETAGEEHYDFNNLKLPFKAGYVIIDQDNRLHAYPTDSPAKWDMYVRIETINGAKKLTLIYVPSGIRPLTPEEREWYSDCGRKSGDLPNCGSNIETYKQNDPDFVKAVVRYFEEWGYRVTSVEEGVEWP